MMQTWWFLKQTKRGSYKPQCCGPEDFTVVCLLQVNNIILQDVRHEEAVAALKNTSDMVYLKVAKPGPVHLNDMYAPPDYSSSLQRPPVDHCFNHPSFLSTGLALPALPPAFPTMVDNHVSHNSGMAYMGAMEPKPVYSQPPQVTPSRYSPDPRHMLGEEDFTRPPGLNLFTVSFTNNMGTAGFPMVSTAVSPWVSTVGGHPGTQATVLAKALSPPLAGTNPETSLRTLS
ncbi:unnamed protein product [Coregonus sp. 'balchen']|nr:unnamed protein product [Coregonus sp. 'balchen']